jgi:uncharacterized protein with GYD domain
VTTYVALANWTDQGARAVADSPRRLNVARRALEAVGGRFVALLMTMGEHGPVREAPGAAVAARFAPLLGRQGRVRAKTLKAFPSRRPGDHRVAGLSGGRGRSAPPHPAL